MISVISRDYQVSKRQFVFYLLDCADGGLKDLCNMREIGKLRDQVNAQFANQIFMGVILKKELYD